MTEQKDKLFTSDYIKVIIVCGLGRICNHMQSVTMPLYIQSIGYSATLAGLMMTVYTLASIVFRPFIGLALDRYRRWPIVVFGTGLFALASATFGYIVTPLFLLFIIRFFHGLGFASHATGINTMGTDVIPKSRLSEGIGYMGLTQSLSTAIAPAIALFLIDSASYSVTFFVISLFALIAVAVSATLRYEYAKDAPPRAVSTEKRSISVADLFEKASLIPSVMIFILSTANTALNTFMASYGEYKGISGVALFFTMNAIAMAIARLTTGIVSKKLGSKTTTRLGIILCIAGYLCAFFSASSYLLWASGLIYGFGYGIVYPVLNAMAVVRAPEGRKGAANATFLTFLDVGIGLGSLLWGFTIDTIGIRWLYLLCAGCVAFSFCLNLLPGFSKMYSEEE